MRRGWFVVPRAPQEPGVAEVAVEVVPNPVTWTPAVAVASLTGGANGVTLFPDGVERTLYVSEHDGSSWSTAAAFVLPPRSKLQIPVAGQSVAMGAAGGGTARLKTSVLPAIVGVTTASVVDPLGWAPAAANIVLGPGQRTIAIEATGTEMVLFVAEHDGTAWRLAHEAILPASGALRLAVDYPTVALGTTTGAALTITRGA